MKSTYEIKTGLSWHRTNGIMGIRTAAENNRGDRYAGRDIGGQHIQGQSRHANFMHLFRFSGSASILRSQNWDRIFISFYRGVVGNRMDLRSDPNRNGDVSEIRIAIP